eukprot:1154233-Pelagomonas_calceolata.AAC.2
MREGPLCSDVMSLVPVLVRFSTGAKMHFSNELALCAHAERSSVCAHAKRSSASIVHACWLCVHAGYHQQALHLTPSRQVQARERARQEADRSEAERAESARVERKRAARDMEWERLEQVQERECLMLLPAMQASRFRAGIAAVGSGRKAVLSRVFQGSRRVLSGCVVAHLGA